MARKSRKELRIKEENKLQPDTISKIPTVLYCRLSKADDITGKDSMENQKQFLRNFVAGKEDLEIKEIFCDDGFSGTNYDRPAYEMMMDGVRAGSYQCIVVKDLSRIGRNYLETSDLLEFELPLFECRFISVNDGIDTAVLQIDTILVGLKNLMNQKYAEDISRKIKVNFKARKEQGQMLGGSPPYGYIRNPENKGYLIIDEEAAGVVRKIFEMKISGMNDTAIARELNTQGILSPTNYKQLKKNGIESDKKISWRADTVKEITLNPVYLGHIVHGKFYEKKFIGDKLHKARKKDWTIYENINPPIVTEETFHEAKLARERIYRRKKK